MPADIGQNQTNPLADGLPFPFSSMVRRGEDRSPPKTDPPGRVPRSYPLDAVRNGYNTIAASQGYPYGEEFARRISEANTADIVKS
jgi:hypothetical protein